MATILLIDDDAQMRMLCQTALEAAAAAGTAGSVDSRYDAQLERELARLDDKG